jgi:two-component system KDP operon response regulator KdpE
VNCADNYSRGELDARSWRPDVIIANVALTEHGGVEFIRALRVWSAIPVVAVSGPATEAQRLAAFDAGADDYVEMPFSSLEFAARTRAILRRHARNDQPQGMLKLGDVWVDLERGLVRHLDGRKVRLTPLERRTLEILARHPGSTITYRHLIREVWGPDMADERALRVYIASLRRKLERDPHRPKHIMTEFGIGYGLVTALSAATDPSPEWANVALADACHAQARGSPPFEAESGEAGCP